MSKFGMTTMLLSAFLLVTSGCSHDNHSMVKEPTTEKDKPVQAERSNTASIEGTTGANQNPVVPVTVMEPDAIPVLVNKENMLPDNYKPTDLVYPDVRFTFTEKIEKRMMRKEAADALELLFQAAKEQGVPLAGVSAYRSQKTQTSLFNHYVEKDGLEAALLYSAKPGTSEHQTGLAIDVTSSDGSCAAEDCFGKTDQAQWLIDNAPTYGFIIRYEEGKESITGYKYEPWHLRYVGKKLAQELTDRGITLEEYYQASLAAK
ncbi:M15 family metallopeptidase [Peribacillus loiseleuriae]|uniref:M15 family metallopeptidase n=1 Tax=Peribacillus loiseleuriae TaxID=1679170 RepID=UPI003CFC2DF6